MPKIEQPTGAVVRAAREAAALDRADAAALVHLGHANRWAEYETEARHIDVARWELFLLKTGQHPTMRATNKRAAA